MITFWCFLILVLFSDSFAHISSSSENSTELVAVVVISRHGDRSPFRSFPNDKYFNESYWPNGLGGEMTEFGINRLYKLGQWLRKRYNHFLSDMYSRKDIYAYATDYDRCLMSITATLAGLYPPKGRQIWNDNLLWQPIPVHSTDIKTDEIVTMNADCPKFHKLYTHIKETKTASLRNEYSEFFEFLRIKTGWQKIGMHDISVVRSVFNCYKNYNMTFLPEWYKEMDKDLLDYLAGVKYAIATATPDLIRLRVGTFYDYIFKYFNKFMKLTSDTPPAKFLMMSGQDILMVGVLDGMGCYKNKPIGFGDTIIWELKRRDGRYYLNLLYRREDKLEQMDCCFNCDYEEFRKSLTDVTVDLRQLRLDCSSV